MQGASLINVELNGAKFDDADFKGTFISIRKNKAQYDEQDLINLLKSKNLSEAFIFQEDLKTALKDKARRLIIDPNIGDEFKDKLRIYLASVK